MRQSPQDGGQLRIGNGGGQQHEASHPADPAHRADGKTAETHQNDRETRQRRIQMRSSEVDRERPGNDRGGLRGPPAPERPPAADASAENHHEDRHGDHAHLVVHGPRSAVENVRRLADHANPRTTEPYDRRWRRIAHNIVERISVQLRHRYHPGSTTAAWSGLRWRCRPGAGALALYARSA